MAKSALKAKPSAETADGFDAVLRLTDLAPQAPDELKKRIRLGIRLTPNGTALAAIDWLTDEDDALNPLLAACAANVCAAREPLLETIRAELIAWFAAPTHRFSIPLAAPRTAFQERLRHALCATESGQTLTYGELAKALRSAPRAVGQALGSNPLPIIVPCHRIISAGKNRLTGFNHARSGPMLLLKDWLLRHEANG